MSHAGVRRTSIPDPETARPPTPISRGRPVPFRSATAPDRARPLGSPLSDDPYDGDTYGDTRGVHDEVADEEWEAYDDTLLPYGGSIYPFEWSIWSSTAEEEVVYEDEAYDREDYQEAPGRRRGGRRRWNEGIIGTLLVVGLFLFLLPEPTISGVGILLIAIGAGE